MVELKPLEKQEQIDSKPSRPGEITKTIKEINEMEAKKAVQKPMNLRAGL